MSGVTTRFWKHEVWETSAAHGVRFCQIPIYPSALQTTLGNKIIESLSPRSQLGGRHASRGQWTGTDAEQAGARSRRTAEAAGATRMEEPLANDPEEVTGRGYQRGQGTGKREGSEASLTATLAPQREHPPPQEKQQRETPPPRGAQEG